MKMTNKTPNNWKELENMTAEIFNNAGYYAIPHYTITTVRGKKEIDVYVHPRRELDPIIICECKFWNKPVNQEVVHSFRTVVQDSGAGLGFIITKSGFQSGAYSAAEFSNVKLVTWDEFLEFFIEDWLNFKRSKLLQLIKPLSVYTDPLDVPSELLDQKQREQYVESIDKYFPVHILATLYKPVSRIVIDKYNEFFNETIESYEEYFDGMFSKATEALIFYDEFFEGMNIPLSHLSFDIEKVSDLTIEFMKRPPDIDVLKKFSGQLEGIISESEIGSFDRNELEKYINEFKKNIKR